ncbi:hypothetical protein GJ496_008980 [Pomphorhynchus laevis]|nr:hypothetical protein GJ496_008980 [Pomphorhynchus laevis]
MCRINVGTLLLLGYPAFSFFVKSYTIFDKASTLNSEIMITALRNFSVNPNVFNRGVLINFEARNLHPYPDGQLFSTGFGSYITTMQLDQIENRLLLVGGSNKSIKIFDMHFKSSMNEIKASEIVLQHSTRSSNVVNTVRWYPVDNGICTSSGIDSELRLWDVVKHREVVCVHNVSGIIDHIHNANNPHIVAISIEHTPSIGIVDFRSPCAVVTDQKRSPSVVNSILWRINRDMQLLTGDNLGHIYLWDIRSALSSPIQTFATSSSLPYSNAKEQTAHTSSINGLFHIPGSNSLISTSSDGVLKVWSDCLLCVNNSQFLTDSCLKFKLPKVRSRISQKVKIELAIADKSEPVLAFVPNDVVIHILEIGKQIKPVGTLRAHLSRRRVTSCAFDQTFCRLYSAGTDRNSIVWIPHRNPPERPVSRTNDYFRTVGDTWSSSSSDFE